MPRRVGLLTGGGDVPGLNVAIRTFVHVMVDAGWEVLGLRRGWKALIALDPGRPADDPEWVVPLDKANTRTIDRTGGTVLHTSRTNPMAVRPAEMPPHAPASARARAEATGSADLTGLAVAAIDRLRLDAVVAIGGDDTLSFAVRLDREGVPVIGIPKTMDNDVFGTDYCIGFSTAITRSVDMVTALRTAAGSHERHLVVELFGRDSGETSLMVALLASADRALISEVPFDPERVTEFLERDRAANPSRYSTLTVSEGAALEGSPPVAWGDPDAFGHRKLGGIGLLLGDYIKRTTGHGIVYQNLAYLMRSGSPDSLDRLVALNFARSAARRVAAGRTGSMMALIGGRYAVQPIGVVAEGVRRVDVETYYDRAAYRPKLDEVIGKPMFLE